MSFLRPKMMTRKKYKFLVTLLIDELSAVPFVTGMLYCKVRLRDGGNFTNNTERRVVQDHRVCWRNKFQFQCKMSADPNTGVLDPCVLRVSVRKEAKGGRTSTKVGLVDLNLAEFAGSNHSSRHCLLEGYDEKNSRQDNSLLQIVISMHLQSGDPCFKIPKVHETTLHLPSEPSSELRVAVGSGSESSGFGSLPRKDIPRNLVHHPNVAVDEFHPSHSREPSSASQQSKLSDYSSRHSRTPSGNSQTSSPGGSAPYSSQTLPGVSEADTVDNDKPNTKMQPPPRPPPPRMVAMRSIETDRMGVTRVDADHIVNQLMEGHDILQNTSTEDEQGLQLFVSADGSSTAFGGQNFHGSMYQPVVIDQAKR